MGTPTDPERGDRHIDATSITIIRYPTDHLNTLTKLREGHGDAVKNVARLSVANRKAAGISAEEVTEILEFAAEHKKVGAFYDAFAEMTENLRHTHLDLGHKLATRLAEVTEQARRRADRTPNGAEILGSLSDLLEYQLGPALKANATKAKAKAAASKGDELADKGDEPADKGDEPARDDVEPKP